VHWCDGGGNKKQLYNINLIKVKTTVRVQTEIIFNRTRFEG